MAYDVYQSAALMLRYGFAFAGAFIAGRSIYMTLRDGRRQASIRAHIKETGVIAHLIAKGHRGENRRYGLNVEGVVGDGRACDIRCTRAGMEKRHFFYEIVNGALRVTALGGAFVKDGTGAEKKQITVLPGGRFTAGEAEFRFVVLRARREPLSPVTRRAYGDTIGIVLGRVRPKSVIRRRVRPSGENQSGSL